MRQSWYREPEDKGICHVKREFVQFIHVEISSSDWRQRSHPCSTAHVLIHRITRFFLRRFALLWKTGNVLQVLLHSMYFLSYFHFLGWVHTYCPEQCQSMILVGYECEHTFSQVLTARIRAQSSYPGTQWYMFLKNKPCINATLFCSSAQAPVIGHHV